MIKLASLPPLLCVLALSSPAQSSADMQAQLRDLKAHSTLNQVGIPPWHLRLHLDRVAAPAIPAESVTLDMAWTAPTDWRLTASTSSSTATRVRSGDQILSSSPPVSAVDFDLLQLFIAPFASFGALEKQSLVAHTETAGSETLHCIVANNAAPGSARVEYTTFCPAPNGQHLRLLERWGDQTVFISRSGTFAGRTIPLDLQVVNGKTLFAQAHVLELASTVPAALAPPPPVLAPLESACDDLKSMPRPSLVAANSLTAERGVSDIRLPTKHASVRLHFIVSANGQPESVEVLHSSDEAWATYSADRLRHQSFFPAKDRTGAAVACPAESESVFDRF